MSTSPQLSEAPRPEVPSPVEATLRILQSSVPHLIGAAVVRQGGTETVAGQLGRVPWLFDRRLTRAELSDEALPENHAILLDWPVPHQAEWVGAPPRLLIARLTAAQRTVGVLLGTLLTREQLDAKTREAVELSCQLLASAVATEQLVRDSEQQARRLQVLNELQRALSNSLDARELGRVLRDAVGFVLEHIGFAVSLFHPQRAEVAYRYRVVDANALSDETARRPLEDGPSSRAAQRAERVVFTREIELPLDGGRTMRRQVHVVQFPLLVQQTPIGVVTVQAFRPDGFSEDELALAETVVETSTNYFAHARSVGMRRPAPEEPRFTLVSGSGPIAPGSDARDTTQPVPAQVGPAVESQPATDTEDGPDRIVHRLLAHLGVLGSPNAFLVVTDEDGVSLRGHSVSDQEFMRRLDTAVGITAGRFRVASDDRRNAIARACRDRRALNAAWLFEVFQPVVTWQDALDLEQGAGGGRCTIVPLVVADQVAGAVVAGPSAQELSATVARQIVARIEAAGDELTRIVRSGESAREDMPVAAVRGSDLSA